MNCANRFSWTPSPCGVGRNTHNLETRFFHLQIQSSRGMGGGGSPMGNVHVQKLMINYVCQYIYIYICSTWRFLADIFEF